MTINPLILLFPFVTYVVKNKSRRSAGFLF